MALISNNNLSPNSTMSPEDIHQAVKSAVGEVVAEVLKEERDKARSSDGKEKAAKLASGASYDGPAKQNRFDTFANKEPSEMDSKDRLRLLARYIHCDYHARMNRVSVLDVAKHFGQHSLVKAMSASDFDNGGFMLDSQLAPDVIEELVARSVYYEAGPVMLDLPEGGLSIPYESDGADAQWAGEGTEVSAEEITGGQIQLQPRKLITVVGISNDFLRGAPGRSDNFVIRSIQRGMGSKLDNTLINSDGSANQPKGLDGMVPSGNTFNVTTEGSLTQGILVEELLYLQTLVEQNNVNVAMDRPFYAMSPRTKNYLRAQRATDGRLFPEMEQGKLLGASFGATSNVSNAVSASYSEIFFVCMDHMLLGRTVDMDIATFDGGTYNDSSGTKRSGISADETVVRVIGKWDHAAGQRGNEIARADNVDWT